MQHILGNEVANYVHQLMKEKRISVIVNASVHRLDGDTKVDKIYFYKAEDKNFENYLDGD